MFNSLICQIQNAIDCKTHLDFRDIKIVEKKNALFKSLQFSKLDLSLG